MSIWLSHYRGVRRYEQKNSRSPHADGWMMYSPWNKKTYVKHTLWCAFTLRIMHKSRSGCGAYNIYIYPLARTTYCVVVFHPVQHRPPYPSFSHCVCGDSSRSTGDPTILFWRRHPPAVATCHQMWAPRSLAGFVHACARIRLRVSFPG